MRNSWRTRQAQQRANKYNINTITYDRSKTLEENYRFLAKKADARMRQIEATSHRAGYQGIKNAAYGRALIDIREFDTKFATGRPSGGKRWLSGVTFDKNGKANNITTIELQKKVNAILTFLNSPTSTARGYKKVFKDRAAKLNAKFGTNLTDDDLRTFFKSPEYHRLKDKQNLTSSTILKMVGQRERNPEDFKKIFEASQSKVLKSKDPNNITDQDILKWLSQSKISKSQMQRLTLGIRPK